MKSNLLFIWFYLFLSEGRLIERTTEKETTTDSNLSGSLKIRREAYGDEPLTGLSQEESGEVVTNNTKYTYLYKSKGEVKQVKNVLRFPRDSKEIEDKIETNASYTDTSKDSLRSKEVLVRKPIPKYNEIDYDEDFQLRINRTPVFVDSVEHEDEDFNVDDYEFDVNHDEFAGRGKPLEPRMKKNHKDKIEVPVNSDGKPKLLPPIVQIQSKVTSSNRVSIVTKEQKEKIRKKLANIQQDTDYYDDTTTKIVVKQNKGRNGEDSGDNEDSEEFGTVDSKTTIRGIRSPWNMSTYMEEIGDKEKVLSILPMFPQLPGN